MCFLVLEENVLLLVCRRKKYFLPISVVKAEYRKLNGLQRNEVYFGSQFGKFRSLVPASVTSGKGLLVQNRREVGACRKEAM
jgi:hypothetical protein